jgi:hypothetical protein
MATKYFRVVGTDNVPDFEPLSIWAGVWAGVVAVSDETLQNKLISQGKTELSEAEYNDELKKKQGLPQRFHDWREVTGSSVAMAAKPAAATADAPPSSNQPASEPPPSVTAEGEETIAAAPLPKARAKSVQKPA